MTGAIRYTCRTPNCPNWISFHSDTFIPKEWECPACVAACEQQQADDLYQRELARKLVQLAEDKERENRLGDNRTVTIPAMATGEFIDVTNTDFQREPNDVDF